MKKSYVSCLIAATRSHPPVADALPTIASEQTEAYVGSRWGRCELLAPPANPPAGDR